MPTAVLQGCLRSRLNEGAERGPCLGLEEKQRPIGDTARRLTPRLDPASRFMAEYQYLTVPRKRCGVSDGDTGDRARIEHHRILQRAHGGCCDLRVNTEDRET